MPLVYTNILAVPFVCVCVHASVCFHATSSRESVDQMCVIYAVAKAAVERPPTC